MPTSTGVWRVIRVFVFFMTMDIWRFFQSISGNLSARIPYALSLSSLRVKRWQCRGVLQVHCVPPGKYWSSVTAHQTAHQWSYSAEQSLTSGIRPERDYPYIPFQQDSAETPLRSQSSQTVLEKLYAHHSERTLSRLRVKAGWNFHSHGQPEICRNECRSNDNFLLFHHPEISAFSGRTIRI